MSCGLMVHRRGRATSSLLSSRAAAVLLAFFGLATAAGCEDGCGTEPPPNNGEPSILITSTSRQLQADGVSFVEVSVRAYDASTNPDNTAITVTVDDGSVASAVHNVGDDEKQLTGTPENGVLTFEFRCDALSTGAVTISAQNGNASATSSVECTEPVGTVSIAVLTDDTYPCTNLIADGESFCRQPVRVELVTPNVTVPQQNQSLTVTVESATLTNPGEGVDPVVTDLDLLSADSDTVQLPQRQVSTSTDADGLAAFRIYTRLDSPMAIRIKVTGSAANGQELDQTVNVTVGAFDSQATVEISAAASSIGSDLTTTLTVTAADHQGGTPVPGDLVKLRVPAESGVVLSADGAVFDETEGTLEVSIEGGTAEVTLDAPVVTALTTVTVTATYQPHPSLPRIADSTEVKIYPENSILLNVEVDPDLIQSDQNEISTLTATVTEFTAGQVVAKQGATVRFTVGSLFRSRVGIGTRQANENPPLNDPSFLLTKDEVSDVDGLADVQISSRNERVRGAAEITVEVLEAGDVVAESTVNIDIEREPILQSIVFVTATPPVIGVRGGAYPSSSVVVFQVFDDLAQPLPNVAMTFDLNATSDPEAVVVPQGMTDATGKVSTTLSAGTQAGPISVVATAFFNGRQMTTESLPIAVTGGLPSFANSYIQCDPDEQAQLPPATINCTVVLADRFTNRAPANLPVQFRAEGGNINSVVMTGTEGSATASFVQGTPGGASTALYSRSGDSWSYGAALPAGPGAMVTDEATRYGVAQNEACFDGNSWSTCSAFDLCFEGENATTSDLSGNLVYCPLRIDDSDDVGCWNKLEAAAVTGDADHLSQALLDDLGITRAAAQTLLDTSMTPQVYFQGTDAAADQVRAIVDAHLDNMFRCGPSTACITGNFSGVSFIAGDECLVAPGCMDWNPSTECPQDGLRTVTAIVRGEESFTDLNGNGIFDYEDVDGNGRHSPGEPVRELGPLVPLDFHDVVVDMPEPFLDKDDNCFADDFTGSLRLTTYDAIRRTDVYSDEDGSGGYGYVLEDPANPGQTLPEPLLTNQQWDRDKEIFFSDHVLIVEGAPRLKVGTPCVAVGADETCPYNGESYLCEPAGDLDGGVLVGCYPRTTDASPRQPNEGVVLRYRWIDNNGNCFSPGFSYRAGVYDDSDFFFFDDIDIDRNILDTFRLTRDHCGVAEYTMDRREWCSALPFVGAPSYSEVEYVAECYATLNDDGIESRKIAFRLSDADVTIGEDTIGTASIALNVNCTGAP